MHKGKNAKPHIGIFGRRNNGKSSLINAIVNQEVAIVSDTPGTTTDPVKKTIEIPEIGPVIMIDTAGIDDVGELGQKRTQKTFEALKIVDCAILVISKNQFGKDEKDIIRQFNEFEIPYFILHNKKDIEFLRDKTLLEIKKTTNVPVLDYSAFNTHQIEDVQIEDVIVLLKQIIPKSAYQKVSLFEGLVEERDLVVLVTPIDKEAPEGRLILPQVMAIRDILDHKAVAVVLQESELEEFLHTNPISPKLVITDSQVFEKVSAIVSRDIPLTGFSLLFARLKGDFEAYLKGTPCIRELQDGDTVLIMESCTHHVNCDDIGRYKIPKMLLQYTEKNLFFEVVNSFQQAKKEIEHYAIVIQCGGCMFTRKQVLNRLKPAIDKGIPVSNYGMSMAYMHGIFERAIEAMLTFREMHN